MNEIPVLTSQQVAEMLQCSSAHVNNMAARGELPGRKCGKLWRFSRAKIMEWLEGKDGSTKAAA